MRTLLSILFIISSLSISAQTAAQKERQQAAREAYAFALEHIGMAQEESNLNNSTHIEMNRMFCGSGMQKYCIDYYYMLTKDPDDPENVKGESEWQPYFIRVKYNHAAFTTTEEYVMNSENKQPIFIFTTSDEAYDKPEEFAKNETRIYFNADGSLSLGQSVDKRADGSVLSSTNIKDIKEIKKFIKNLYETFDSLVNQKKFE